MAAATARWAVARQDTTTMTILMGDGDDDDKTIATMTTTTTMAMARRATGYDNNGKVNGGGR